MIAPAVTGWPANTWTPSRLAAESRPFLDEPRPFLCAIRSSHPLDRDLRQLGAVTPHLLEPALGLVREHAQLLAAQVADDLGRHDAVQAVAVDDDVAAARHEHLRGECVARLEGLPVDHEPLALLDAVLLASDLDHGVH